MTQLNNLLPDAGKGMTVSEFEALREIRRSTFAASGFIEPGRHYTDASNEAVNQGIWCTSNGGPSNTFRMGRAPTDSTKQGDSLTDYPVYNVDGIRIVQGLVGASTRNSILLPEAPNAQVETSTTTTRDYAQGDHVVVGNDIYVCILDAPTGMLLTDITYFAPVDMVSREDIVGIEVFLAEIGTGDGQVPAVYPLGNVQYNGSSDGTKNYTDGAMPQSYSAFGTWDTVTWGRGVLWDEMTDSQRDSYLNNPDNNIYRDGDRIYQWQYRFRSDPSVVGAWAQCTPYDNEADSYIRTRDYVSPTVVFSKLVLLQGTDDTPGHRGTSNYFNQHRSANRVSNIDPGVATSIEQDDSVKSVIYWLPIARVTRLNKGAYHPFYNSMGTLLHAQENSGGSTWDSTVVAKSATSIADCFLNFENGGSRIRNNYGGNIKYGSSGHPLGYTYDNIYAWAMEDLRISAHGIDVDSNSFGIDLMGGRVRGWESYKGLAIARSTLKSNDIVAGEFTADPAGKITKMGDGFVKEGGCWVYNVDKDQYVPAVKVNYAGRDDYYYYLPSYVNPTLFEDKSYTNSSKATSSQKGTKLYEGWDVGDEIIIMMSVATPHSLEKLPVTEAFVKPTVLADTLDRYGVDYVPGLIWAPVLPDDTSKTQPLTRRVVDKENHLATSSDLGASWVNSNTYTSSFDSGYNTGSVNMPAATIMLMSYNYSASIVEPIAISERRVLATADLGHVFVLRADERSTLIPSLIGKIGPPNNSVIYTKQALDRAIMTYNEGEGGAFETAWSDNVIHHSNVSLRMFGDCVKFLPFLSEDLVEGVAYGNVVYRELKYDDDPKTITEIDLSNSVTHGLGINDRFIIKNCSNPVMNNVVFVTKLPPDSSWDNNSFDGYTINYEDGSVYKPDGTRHATFQVDPTNDVGDDNAMQYYQYLTFMTNLNDYRVARGLSRTRRPLGFLPKEKR